ncbi:phage integrase central domain-containing protein [Roseospira marina]|uniref:phage integrase central domain-containing protein n=1 Tax=Roseospira marina TaxID=140057 RepID=UPI0035D41DB8
MVEPPPACQPDGGRCHGGRAGSPLAPWFSRTSAHAWDSTRSTYVLPTLGTRPAGSITTEDVLAVLAPVWRTHPETASRLRARIETVLDYARVRGWASGGSPARWSGHLEHLLPHPRDLAPGQHHRAVPRREAPIA